MNYKGTIKHVIAQKENGWCAFTFMSKETGKVNASGISSVAVSDGLAVELEGELVNDPKWGRKLNFRSLTVVIGKGKAAIRAFLSSGFIKGVGPKTAALIVEKFGADTLNIIENEPEKLRLIKGISTAKAEIISRSCIETKQMMAIFELLDGQVTKNQASKIVAAYGSDAVSRIKADPYCLIRDIDGFGFRRADEIAKASGLPEDSPARIMAGIVYALDTASDFGDCYLTREELVSASVDVLLPAPKIFDRAKDQKYAVLDMRAGIVPTASPEVMAAAARYTTDYPVFIALIEKEIDRGIDNGVFIDDGGRISMDGFAVFKFVKI